MGSEMFIRDRGKIAYSTLVASVTVFAIGFIMQGALDAAHIFFGFNSYDQVVVFLEVLTGFLLAVFGGLLNASFQPADEEESDSEPLEKADSSE